MEQRRPAAVCANVLVATGAVLLLLDLRRDEPSSSVDRAGVVAVNLASRPVAAAVKIGVRISEIATAQAGEGWIQVIGKGNKERRVPCPDWLCDAVKNAKSGEQIQEFMEHYLARTTEGRKMAAFQDHHYQVKDRDGAKFDDAGSVFFEFRGIGA